MIERKKYIEKILCRMGVIKKIKGLTGKEKKESKTDHIPIGQKVWEKYSPQGSLGKVESLTDPYALYMLKYSPSNMKFKNHTIHLKFKCIQ